ADMLELDLDLEADLGVDTVKQAEIFVALRETYGIPRDDALRLRDFPTLSHVIGFVKERAVAGNEPPAAVSEPVATPAEQPDIVPIATPAGPTEEEVKERVLGLVAEKTGYPADMLELDLDLEADLGVDTVKQAEIFVALRETYGIPRDDALKLRDFPTLAHVIGFVRERAARSTPSIATPERVEEPAKQQPEPLLERAIAGLDAANVIPRRIPVPVLRPPLDRCKETSATLRAGGRVVVMADASGVAKELSRHLEAMEVEPLLIDDAPSVEVLSERLRAWLERGPIAGVYWLASLDPSLPLRTMDLPQWREALRVRVKLLFATMRALVAADGPPPFLVAGTRMGGLHGYDDAGAADPLGGAVTGFVKAFGRELPAALVKAVDFGEDTSADGAAGRLLDETLKDPGAVEIGYRDGLRWGISLDERPAPKPDPSLPFGAGTVFAVTGAAGSIVSAIVSDLAAATGATFHLLDLAPEPNPADPDLLRFTSDREGLKRDLFDRIKARGERATPAVVDRELANLERARAAVSSMEAIHAAGGTARYHEVNLLDADAVGRAIEDIVAESGRIDVLIHAAGIEISHLIADKEPREFDLVFDVKADGLFNVMHSLGERNPRAVVVFSSVAGRFGNAGQTDYSAANGLQCTVASSLRRTRTGTRGIAIDWTAWAKIGMATRGSIPKMMELAGIDMLEPEAGIPVVRRELLGGTDGEVVIGGRLGALLAEPDDTGGVMPGAWTAPVAALPWTATAMTIHGGLTARADLDPTTEPFLDNHRIDGTPVLPGVMGMESFAEVALLVLPGLHVAAIDDVEFLAPFKFYRDTPRTLTVEARFTHEGDDIVAACRLLGIRELPNQPDPQVTTHFTGTVRLSRTPGPLGSSPLPDRTGAGVGTEDVYSVFFHGPAYRVLERVWTGSGGATGLMTAALPPDFHGPIPPAIAPRLIELCFQTAAAWDIAAEGRFGLPTKVGTVRVSSEQSPNGPLVASVTHVDGRTDATVVDETGRILVELKGYESVELPGAIDLDTKSAKAFRAAMA
ncbi:MAG: SDR family NAD(P)-dependent oxidoreductase, partial [Actinomycetota bacterium]